MNSLQSTRHTTHLSDSHVVANWRLPKLTKSYWYHQTALFLFFCFFSRIYQASQSLSADILIAQFSAISKSTIFTNPFPTGSVPPLQLATASKQQMRGLRDVRADRLHPYRQTDTLITVLLFYTGRRVIIYCQYQQRSRILLTNVYAPLITVKIIYILTVAPTSHSTTDQVRL